MDWFKNILKGSGHKHSEGHYHGGYAGDPQIYAPSGTGDAWLDHGNEEIDRAIALSLPEESQKGRNVINDESQLEEDEQLARALQESLTVEPPPQYENANTYHPIPVQFPMGYRICAACNSEIGHGRFLNCLNAYWHPECFRCHACNLAISDYEGTSFWIQKYCLSHEHYGTP